MYFGLGVQFIERVISLHINGMRLLLFSYFVAYGFYGAVSPALPGLMGLAVSSAITIALMFPPWILWKRGSHSLQNQYLCRVDITMQNLFIMAVGFAILLMIGFESLNRSLFSDELSYAGSAHGHGILLATMLAKLPLIAYLKFKYTLQLLSFFVLIFLYLIWRITGTSSKKAFGLYLIVFAIFRLAFIVRGGNANPHPPLELLSPLVSGSIFGINELGLRLVGVVTFAAFLFVIYRMVRRKCNRWIALSALSIIGSMPLALEMMTAIEHAFWAYMIFTVVIFDLATSTKINYQRLVILVSIGTLFRQSVFIAFVPIFIMYIADRKDSLISLSLNLKDIKLLYPAVLFAPFLLQSILLGTPATKRVGDGLLNLNLYQALTSGIVIESFNRVFQPFWWITILFCFLINHGGRVRYNISIIVFAFILICIYYSIDAGLWGLAKYQAEYALPFVSLGIFLMGYWLQSYVKPIILCLISLFITALNIYTYEHNYYNTHWTNRIAASFNYRDAYLKVHNLGLTFSTISIGATYGILPEIINNYNGSEILRANAIYKDNKNLFASYGDNLDSCVNLLNGDIRISSVLIQGNTQGEILRQRLNDVGWFDESLFCNSFQKSCIFLLRKI